MDSITPLGAVTNFPASSTGEIDEHGDVVGELVRRIGVAATVWRPPTPGRRERLLAACAGDHEHTERVLRVIGGGA